MKLLFTAGVLIFPLLLIAFVLPVSPAFSGEKGDTLEDLPNGLYAIFYTSMGEIVCELYEKQAPNTVANFVGLATGEKEWTDPRTGKKEKKALYKDLVFHRVIPDFMIQTGDPLGTGTGGPGYKFADEFDMTLKFDRPGRLAMANSGPNTNGSQIFFTHGPTPWLDNHHTIFGQVVKGQDVVNKIGAVPRDYNNKPLKSVVLKEVKIVKKQ